jgi:dTDP-glucose 4,6-dehydratase
VLLTGGAGFIGSAMLRALLGREWLREAGSVVVLDALTYAGHRVNLAELEGDPRWTFVHGDICDRKLVDGLFAKHPFDAVLHLAAESHVDRSIEAADEFIRTNVTGTFTLLDSARRAWSQADGEKRFVHVSTDEVYGALGETGHFTEESPYAPNSPYAASKASSDLLARSYFVTHRLPVVITNTCNNYGPRQLPEKLIPLTIRHAVDGKPLPVYGEGKQCREWIHVDDHCDGLLLALEKGVPGQKYNFGSDEESSNLALVKKICAGVDTILGRDKGATEKQITFVPDRKGHDFRYAIDSSKAKRELGFAAKRRLDEHIVETIRWNIDNAKWHEAVRSDEHSRFQKSYYTTLGGST